MFAAALAQLAGASALAHLSGLSPRSLDLPFEVQEQLLLRAFPCPYEQKIFLLGFSALLSLGPNMPDFCKLNGDHVLQVLIQMLNRAKAQDKRKADLALPGSAVGDIGSKRAPRPIDERLSSSSED